MDDEARATGLDPAGMRDMRALIRRLAEEGITVLLSSHQLPEVQELCDRVAIVDRGRVVYEGALSDLRRQGGAGYRLRTTDDARALELSRSQPGIEHAASVARDRVLEAATYIPVAQLGTTDDCGFSPFCDDVSTTRETAFAKIRARVLGTALASQVLRRT